MKARSPTAAHAQTLARLAKALAHPARVAILQFLARQPNCYCGRIVDELPLAQSTVSQHLAELKDAGLVQGTVDGLNTCYCLDRARIAAARDLLGKFFDRLNGAPRADAQADAACCPAPRTHRPQRKRTQA